MKRYNKKYLAKITIKGGNQKDEHIFYENVIPWGDVGLVLEVIAKLEYRRTGKK